MAKTFTAGLSLAALGVVVLLVGWGLNLGLGSITFGLAVGGILGLIGDGSSALARLGGFVIGVVVAMSGYVEQVLGLPGDAGIVIEMLIVFVVTTALLAATGGRLPLWTGLLGIALVSGAYQQMFVDEPQDILPDIFVSTSQALVPAAFGFLVAIFVAPRGRWIPDEEQRPESTPVPSGISGRNSEV